MLKHEFVKLMTRSRSRECSVIGEVEGSFELVPHGDKVYVFGPEIEPKVIVDGKMLNINLTTEG